MRYHVGLGVGHTYSRHSIIIPDRTAAEVPAEQHVDLEPEVLNEDIQYHPDETASQSDSDQKSEVDDSDSEDDQTDEDELLAMDEMYGY
jgi:hypothetical protein